MWILIAMIVGIGLIAAAAELLSKHDDGEGCADGSVRSDASNCDSCAEVNCAMKGLMERKKDKKV